jgi:hypothetical protein
MVRYWTNQVNYLEIAKSYQAMYDTPKVKENPDLWKKVSKREEEDGRIEETNNPENTYRKRDREETKMLRQKS